MCSSDLKSFSNKYSDEKNKISSNLNDFKLILNEDFWTTMQSEKLMESEFIVYLKNKVKKYEFKLANQIDDIKNHQLGFEDFNTFNNDFYNNYIVETNKKILLCYKKIKKLTNWNIYISFKYFLK